MKHPLGRTKARLIEELEAGTKTASELARSLGLSPVAVHRHLNDLLERGLVAYEIQKNGRGRPSRRWRVRRDGFCPAILAKVKARIGADGLTALLVEWHEERLAGVRTPEHLVARLRAEGYAPRVLEEEDGLLLLQTRCPRLELARAHPELCAAEAWAFSALLGRPVALSETLAKGAAACRFHLGTG